MLTRILVVLLRVYRWTLSPLLGNVCRFHPSCSHYAEGCLLTHGVVRGSFLTLKRLAKCHPFHPGGYDPVPPRTELRVEMPENPRASKSDDVVPLVPAVTSQDGLL